jgi:Leucine-rich repeat (LRR) protein
MGASGWSQPWSIEIRDTEISGEIFSVINNASSLEYLDLRRNEFNGSLPDFTDYTLLSELKLQGNNFEGGVPESIGLLTNLIDIDLSENNLSGSLPSSMANLTQLQYFNISDNNFSGSFPDFISSWQDIQVIIAANNNFTGTIDDDWSELTQIIGVVFSNNNLEGAFPQINSSDLTALYIEGNNFTSLPTFPNFNFSDNPELLLQNNKLTFADLEQFIDPSLIDGDNFFYAPQQVLGEPLIEYILEGESYVLDANPIAGTSLSYQWYKDDVAVTDSTNATYTILNFSQTNEGTYRVEATSSLLPSLTSVGPDITLILNDFLVDPQDSLALVAFYNATDGPNWTNNTNWLTGNVEDWFGVNVTDGRVNLLEMQFNNVTGQLPEEIGELDALTVLILANKSSAVG